MNSETKHGWAVRVLAVLAICISLWWLSGMLRGALRSSDCFFTIFMPIFGGFPGFVGLYCGYKGLRRVDVPTIKGLVGGYCIFLVVFASGLVAKATEYFGVLSEQMGISIIILPVTISAIGVYWFTSRWLLRLLGLRALLFDNHCQDGRWL